MDIQHNAKPKRAENSAVKCGIVMPISATSDCSETHWSDVMTILVDSLESAGFEANLVSNADEVTIIQKTIVNNLYYSPVVVCDVSEKNPNVMFELGMRLAFDKPTIIIKDDCTSFSFDTGVVEHLEYPRDLRFHKIVDFKQRLAEKVLATYEKQQTDPNYSTFLKHFGQFKIAKIDEKEVDSQEFIVEQLNDLKRSLEGLSAPFAPSRRPVNYPAGNEIDICCSGMDNTKIEAIKAEMERDDRIKSVRVVVLNNHVHLYAQCDIDSVADRREMEIKYREISRNLKRRKRATNAIESHH
jgi:hypothetical protein